MDNITVLIPVSAIPSHPSTEVLDQTVDSIRERLPNSEIIIMFDGVPAWLMPFKQGYQQFTQRVLWRAAHELDKVLPLVFDDHMHQSGMVRVALEHVNTPVILFAEQDTPLTGDIPFRELAAIVETGYANVIRLHHEASIHPEHEYLMLDKQPIEILGQPFIRSRQWSQRPHLASTEFYRSICSRYWTKEPRFIEHIMYGPVVAGAYDEFRLHIYAPQGTLVRSLHTDGRRKGAKEYDPTPS